MQLTAKSLAARCSALFACYYMLYYVVCVMTTTYLLAFGYSAATVALLLSVASIVSLVVHTAFTGLVEKGRCRPLACGYILSAAAASAAFFLCKEKSIAVVLVYVVFAQSAITCFMELLDPWMLKLIKQRGGLDFGGMRAFGSASYAVASLCYGWAVARFGYGISLPVILALLGVCLAVVLSVPNPDGPVQPGHTAGPALGRYLGLLKNRRFLAFLFFNTLICFTWILSDNFINVYIYDLGGTPAHTGLCSCVMAIIEFVMLLKFTRIADAVGTERVVWLGMLGYGAKSLLVSFMPTPAAVILACCLQAVALGFYLPGKMRFIEQEIPRESVAGALMLCTVTMSLSNSLIANPIAARIVDASGSGTLLRVLGVNGLVAGLGFALALRLLPKKGGEAGAGGANRAQE